MKGLGRTGGVMGALFAVMMLFAVPIVLYNMVPLARREVADYFVQAAQDWKQYTIDNSKTPGPYDGVLVDWRDVIAVEAVKRNQDFRNVTYDDAYKATQRFTYLYEWEECHWHYPPEDETWEPWEHCTEYWKYVPYEMDKVMADEGFTSEQMDWAYELTNYARLLVEDNIECHYDSGNQKWVCNK